MNVGNTARVPQYEVERSIRAVKAAAEQSARQDGQQAIQAQGVRAAQSTQGVQTAQGIRGTERQDTVQAGQSRPPQVDAYIPRSPRAPIEEDEDAPAVSARQAVPPQTAQAVPPQAAQTAPPQAAQTAPPQAASARDNPEVQDRAEGTAVSTAAARLSALSASAQAAVSTQSLSPHGADTPSALGTFGETEEPGTSGILSVQDAAGEGTGLNAAGEGAGLRQGTATYNTDKVDQEVQGLKSKLEQVQRQARSERNVQEAEKLENEAVQLRRELLWKSTDAYRRQTAAGVLG